MKWFSLSFQVLVATFWSVSLFAQIKQGSAEFLFLGAYHMANPGRDVNNIDADDILSERRQSEVQRLCEKIARFKPNKIMVEVSVGRQSILSDHYGRYLAGNYALAADETEQIGFRISKESGSCYVLAVDWNDLGPIKDENSIDYVVGASRIGKQRELEDFLEFGRNQVAIDDSVLRSGSVEQMLIHLNSEEWRRSNAKAYFRLGRVGTPDEPVGLNWLQYWYGRNLVIFGNIVDRTMPGDRVLVIFGAGHANHLIQLAKESGFFNVHEFRDWVSR